MKMYDFFLALICFLLLLISLLALIPVLCICQVFTLLLKICLSIKHSQWIKFVDNYDAFLLIQKDKVKMVANAFMIFHGTFDLEDIKTTIKTKWTNVKKKDQYKHLHLRQHTTDSCGYFFWLQDDNFSTDDHVQLYDCKPPANQNELDGIFSELCSQALATNKSPWLILLFPLDEYFAEEPHQYVVFFRFHHCLGDGYNLTQMICRCFLDEKCIKIPPHKPKKAFPLFTVLTTFFYFPKFIIESLIIKDRNILHGPPQTEKTFVRPLIFCSLERVKTVAKATGATINDIMVSCIGGALKRYFSECKAPPLGDVRCAIPIAMPVNLKDCGFKNEVAGIMLPLAISENTAVERLRRTQQETSKFKAIPFYYISYLLFKLLFNRLPAHITNIFYREIDVTCIISNVPLLQNPGFNHRGKQLVACNTFPPLNNNTGM
uniref:Uncharacterized protein n=1 Tax=Strigamia maritima TaxID=126957 RepID=T1IXG7_STRMM